MSMQENNNYKIALPPREFFEQAPSVNESIIDEGSTSFIADKVEIDKDKGILLTIRGADHPKKGFPFPEAIYAINQAKRLLREFLVLGRAHWYLVPFFNINKIIDSYCSVALRNLQPFIIKPECMQPAAKETLNLISLICKPLKINVGLAKIISAIIQYDDAYSYRLQDIMSETTKDKLLKNPIRETRRLLKLLISRESGEYQRLKMKPIVDLSTVLLLIPKYRKSIIYALENCEFSNFQYDEADKYWVMNRSDYKYMGLTHEERIKRFGRIPMGIKLKRE
jgi:hypothetical protein